MLRLTCSEPGEVNCSCTTCSYSPRSPAPTGPGDGPLAPVPRSASSLSHCATSARDTASACRSAGMPEVTHEHKRERANTSTSASWGSGSPTVSSHWTGSRWGGPRLSLIHLARLVRNHGLARLRQENSHHIYSDDQGHRLAIVWHNRRPSTLLWCFDRDLRRLHQRA
jgi:hypothetical protein